MAKNELGYLDYVKAAFNAKVKVPGLGKVPFNWLGLIGIGAVSLAFPFIAMIGAGAELFYLYVLSSDKRFKNFVKAEQLQKLKNSEEDIKRVAVMQLPVKDRQSYYALLEKCNKIRQLAENYSTGMVSDSLRDSYDSLNELLDVSLKLLSTKNVINKFVQTDEIETVEEKIKSIQKLEANETSESAKKSYQSTLEILNKRLVVLKNAEEKLKSINIDLLRISEQLDLVLNEAALNKESLSINERIDQITAGLAQANQWVKTSAELFAPLEEEISKNAIDSLKETQGVKDKIT